MSLGQNIPVMGNWFILHFTENNGMAFGIEISGIWGKLFLTFFRMIAVGGIIYYLVYQIKRTPKPITIILISLILAGAMGNIFDSVFYGKWFTESKSYVVAEWANGSGYSTYFRGKVVDMLYFPLIHTQYPSWFPYIGGKTMIFFRPVFNLADAAISTGVFSILLFKRDLFQFKSESESEEEAKPPVEEIVAPSQEDNSQDKS
jgi:signal peptidase II